MAGTGISNLRGQSNQGLVAESTGADRRWRRHALPGVFALLALSLMGCSTISDETAGRAFVSPGRYSLYPCINIDARIKEVSRRRTELEQLMARSSQGAGGDFINAIAYRTEYLQTGGDLEELARASSEKKCAVDSNFSSRRMVY